MRLILGPSFSDCTKDVDKVPKGRRSVEPEADRAATNISSRPAVIASPYEFIDSLF